MSDDVTLERLDERLKALREDLHEFKSAERDFGLKTDRSIKDLYDKIRDVTEKLSNLKVKVYAINATVAILVSVAVMAIKSLLF